MTQASAGESTWEIDELTLDGATSLAKRASGASVPSGLGTEASACRPRWVLLALPRGIVDPGPWETRGSPVWGGIAR